MTTDQLLGLVDILTGAFDSIPREDRGAAAFKSAGTELSENDYPSYLTVVSRLHNMAYFLTDIASGFPMPDILADHLNELDRKKLEEYPTLRRYCINGHMGSAAGNKDLFVTAPDLNTAIKLWMEYYEITPENLRDDWGNYEDVRLVLAPQLGDQPMAHPWSRVLSWNLMPDGNAGPHTDRD